MSSSANEQRVLLTEDGVTNGLTKGKYALVMRNGSLTVVDWEGNETAVDSNLDSTFDAQGAISVVNAQPNTAAHMAAWTTGGGGSAPPVRFMVFGDSHSTGFDLGPNMRANGFIGQSVRNPTGTVTTNVGDFAKWINGNASTFAIGSSGEYTQNGQPNGDVRGDTAFVAYIAQSGGGSFDIETQANGTGGWTKQGATVNTSNASTIGVATTRALSTTYLPAYRVRINNVTGGPVTIICAGVYYANGGGVLFTDVGRMGGIDVASSITTPAAIFNPIWLALAPKLIVSSWADGASNWESGGAFRTFYAAANAAYTGGTDWIVCSSNVTLNETNFPEQRVAQRQWALDFNQTWINGRAWSPDWATCLALGWVTDDASDVHLSAYGQVMRNMHLYHNVPVFSWNLGRLAGPHAYGYGTTPMWDLEGNGNLDSATLTTQHGIASRGGSAGVVLGDRAQAFDRSTESQIYCNAGTYYVYLGANRMSIDNTYTTFFHGLVAGSSQSLTGAGAIAGNVISTKLTSTGASEAVTLPNGVDGQIKTIVHAVDGGSMVLTPTTKTGYTTITFTNAGESALLQYFTTIGWVILSLRGAVAA